MFLIADCDEKFVWMKNGLEAERFINEVSPQLACLNLGGRIISSFKIV